VRNFVFQQPTRIIFGRGLIGLTGDEAAHAGRRIMLVSGRSSLKSLGIYQRIHTSLIAAGLEVIEFAGVRSNPLLSHVRSGIALAKAEKIEAVVAAGGGSVLDSGKAIAAGAMVNHEVWSFFKGKKSIRAALPMVAIPTVAGDGSEVNGGMVLTNEETRRKIGIGNRHLVPAVAILDPETTFSLPREITANGAVDAFCHLLEFYLNREEEFAPLQDRYSAGLMQGIIIASGKAITKPDDYQCRAELMWAASLAMNGLAQAGLGRVEFPLHLIEHSISALHDVAHGAGLAALLPGFLKLAARKNPRRPALLATQIFGIEKQGSERAMAFAGIARLKEWLEKIGAPTSLAALGISAEDLRAIASNSTAQAGLWRLRAYPPEVVREILAASLAG